MPDRIVRDELLESGRWLDLPTDTDRIAFLGLLLIADDFGNIEGGPRRLFRFLHKFTQVKTEEGAATTLLHLAEADLLRRYEIDGREFFHLPRFRPHRQYMVRKMPPSPWDNERKLGKDQRVIERGFAKIQTLEKNLATTSHAHGSDVAQGVGVGVGVGANQEESKSKSKARSVASRLPPGWHLPDEWLKWATGSAGIEEEKAVRQSLIFRDYWYAKAGKDAAKLDWFATWRNWIRRGTT